MMEIKEISIEDENYPERLKKIKDPPKRLYFVGEIKRNEECLAIVGSRIYTPYGKEVAIKFAREIAESGLTIVSGFAPGIDTFSHLAAVEKKKRTIAVLGTGLDKKSIYPKSNLKLVEKILECNGCLISELPPGQKGSKFTFPRRNRIISGLSLGVLVIEARKDSGALITANFAFSQKKKVFAVPGSIFSKNSKGCHFLIKRGAILVEEPKEIFEHLNIDYVLQKKKIEGEKEEILILECLKGGSLSTEEIVQKTKLPASKVLSLLSLMEIEGKVKNLGGDIWCFQY